MGLPEVGAHCLRSICTVSSTPRHTCTSAYHLFFGGALLFVLGKILVVIYGRDLVWGLHHWAFYSSNTQFAALLTTLVLLLLIYRQVGYITVLRLLNHCRLSQTVVVAVAMLSFPVFYLLRVRHLLLGDAFLLVESLQSQELGFSLGGKNDNFVHAFLYQLFPSLDPWTLYALTSSLAGTVHILGVLSIVNTLARDPLRKWLVFTIAISTGALQLFCGYVETYTLMAAFLTLTLVFLVRWSGFKITWLAAAVCSAFVAFLLHPIAVFLCAPLLCAIGYQIYTWSRENKYRAFIGIGLLTGGFGIVLHFLINSMQLSPTHFGFGREAYGLFSVEHLTDVANELLLLVPVHALLLSSLVLRRTERCRPLADPVLLVLAVGAAAAFTISFLIEPLLGSLDWDLLSLYAIPFGLLTAYVSSRKAPSYILFPFVTVTLFHLLPWLIINTNLQRGGAMVGSMVERDYHHRGERNYILGARMTNLGLPESGAQQFRKALQADPDNDLAYQELGMYYYERNNLLQALPLLTRSLECADVHTDTRFISSLLAYHQNRLEEAAFNCSTFLLDHPDHTAALSLAAQMVDRSNVSEANRMMLQVALLYSQKDYLEAIELCTQLAKGYKDRTAVAEFSKKIYEKMKR